MAARLRGLFHICDGKCPSCHDIAPNLMNEAEPQVSCVTQDCCRPFSVLSSYPQMPFHFLTFFFLSNSKSSWNICPPSLSILDHQIIHRRKRNKINSSRTIYQLGRCHSVPPSTRRINDWMRIESWPKKWRHAYYLNRPHPCAPLPPQLSIWSLTLSHANKLKIVRRVKANAKLNQREGGSRSTKEHISK